MSKYEQHNDYFTFVNCERGCKFEEFCCYTCEMNVMFICVMGFKRDYNGLLLPPSLLFFFAFAP